MLRRLTPLPQWVETTCFALVLPRGKDGAIPLKGGDDAKRAQWWHLSDELPQVRALYASHHAIVAQALRRLASDESQVATDAIKAAASQVAAP